MFKVQQNRYLWVHLVGLAGGASAARYLFSRSGFGGACFCRLKYSNYSFG